jgi:hypothetical protein
MVRVRKLNISENILFGRRVCGWVDMSLEGRTSVDDSEGSGHPSTTTSDGKQEKARPMILKDSNNCKVFRYVTK